MQPLTPRQHEVLEFIRGYMAAHRRAPSHREVKAHLRCVSLNAVSYFIGVLARKGVIVVEFGAPRGITLRDSHGCL